MRAGHSHLLHVRPRYPQSWLIRFHFEAPDLDRLLVKRINVEGTELLCVWPIPALVFERAEGLVMPIIWASVGLTLELVSDVDQLAIVAIEFSEFKPLRKGWQ